MFCWHTDLEQITHTCSHYVCSLYLYFTDEEHFNSNVQLRRTARHDVGVAQKLQEEEVQVFRKEEAKRKQEMKQK